MRGALFLFALIGLLIAGCTEQPEPADNVTNYTNITNVTNETNQSDITCLGPVCGADGTTYATDCEAFDAGIAVLHTGPCEEKETCEETDGGIDLETLGTVSKGNKSYSDYCIDSQLVEYTCIDDSIEMATFSCGQNKECKDGACVAASEPEPEVYPGCIGPVEADMYSAMSTTYNGTVYQDVCIESDVVKEYYCQDNMLKSINMQCPLTYGCKDGKCEELVYECNDGDNGTDIFERERVLGLRGFITIYDHWDECVDGGKVKEYYCTENNTGASMEIECGSGYKCANGRCIVSKCSETDGGLDYFKFGVLTVEGHDKDYEDKCFTDYDIREYYCYGDDVEYKETRCPKGYICLDTRCVEGSIS